MIDVHLYYEKRKIENFKGDVFYIWSIYKLDHTNREVQLFVLYNEEEFNDFKKHHKVNYRKYTARGIE